MFRNLSEMAEFRKIAKVSGTSSSIDMKGFDSIMILVDWDSDNDANKIVKLEQSPDDSNWEDVEDSNIDVGEDEDAELGWVEVHKPQKRYLRIVTEDNATDLNTIITIKFRAFRDTSIDNDETGEITGDLLTSPDDGTP